MTISKITIIALSAIIMTACGSSKKSSTPSAAAPSIIPGDAQLTAIKAKYPDATAEQLKQGHSIYIGACTNCHGQKNIFKRSEASWLHEIDDMSPKAKLTAEEKDALTKYILAMKATQTPETK
jgi:mono/diheme cytochrome c family protein